MADLNYDDYAESSGASLGGTLTACMNWAGAVMSLTLIGGLAVWGYEILVRDVTGVPVVRSLEGPMRIAPEDPGGSRAAYQGLAVNRIAAEGAAAQPPERVVLAPPEPELAAEDQPMAALLPDAPGAPIEEVRERKVSAIDLAVAEALGESPAVLLAAASERSLPVPEPAVAVANEPIDEAGIAVSPRPEPRPENLPVTELASLDTELPPIALEGGVDADPDTIATGARLVQLGAFPSEDLAQAEWDAVMERFGDFMEGKRRVIQPAEAGGRAFYRLRVLGFEDLADSRRFCAVLVAGEASCIPVAWR